MLSRESLAFSVAEEAHACSQLLHRNLPRQAYTFDMCHTMPCYASPVPGVKTLGHLSLGQAAVPQEVRILSYLVAPTTMSQLPQAPILPSQPSITQLSTLPHPSAQHAPAMGQVPSERPGRDHETKTQKVAMPRVLLSSYLHILRGCQEPGAGGILHRSLSNPNARHGLSTESRGMSRWAPATGWGAAEWAVQSRGAKSWPISDLTVHCAHWFPQP